VTIFISRIPERQRPLFITRPSPHLRVGKTERHRNDFISVNYPKTVRRKFTISSYNCFHRVPIIKFVLDPTLFADQHLDQQNRLYQLLEIFIVCQNADEDQDSSPNQTASPISRPRCRPTIVAPVAVVQ